MITAVEERQCTGCQACAEICPKGAVRFCAEGGTFLLPILDPEKCISCGLCLKTCPSCEEGAVERYVPVQGYTACGMDSDSIRASASGGAFALMARHVIQQGGSVYGAVFCRDLSVRHMDSEAAPIEAMQGSKYVQSDVNHTYRAVREKLTQGRTVLYSGTPCQIAGLRAYLAKSKTDMRPLLTVDLICHGVPSGAMLKQYIRHLEQKYHKKIEEVRFRNRHKSEQNGYVMKIRFADQTIKWIYYDQDLYYRAFVRGYLYRESCYQCRYASLERVGDITIGDCATWRDHTSVESYQILSSVLINTPKGEEFWESIRGAFYAEPLDIVKEQKMNQQLHTPSHKPHDYEKVLRCFQTGDYQGAQSGTGLTLSAKKWLFMQLKSRLNWKTADRMRRLLHKPDHRKTGDVSV